MSALQYDKRLVVGLGGQDGILIIFQKDLSQFWGFANRLTTADYMIKDGGTRLPIFHDCLCGSALFELISFI